MNYYMVTLLNNLNWQTSNNLITDTGLKIRVLDFETCREAVGGYVWIPTKHAFLSIHLLHSVLSTHRRQAGTHPGHLELKIILI